MVFDQLPILQPVETLVCADPERAAMVTPQRARQMADVVQGEFPLLKMV